MRGPCVATGAASTSGTTCTAWGLPIDSAEIRTGTPSTSQDFVERALAADERHSAGAKRGTPMSTLTCPSASSLGTMSPPAVSTRSLALGREPLVADEDDEAARAVAALLDLAAVGVEDPVAEVRVALRALDQQHLVAADAEAAIREPPHLRRRSSMRCRTPSSTTKSLPRPCIW